MKSSVPIRYSCHVLVLGAFLLRFTSLPSFGQAQFGCSDRIYFFQSDSTYSKPNGFLSYFENYQKGKPKITRMCPMPTFMHNSLAANPVDSFLYYTADSQVYRLDADCKNTYIGDLGFISFSGSFDWQGKYWVCDQNNSMLYAYDVKERKFVKGPIKVPYVADVTYNLFDCHLYMMSADGMLFKMDTSGNIVSKVFYEEVYEGNGEYVRFGAPGGIAFGGDGKIYAMQGSKDGGQDNGYLIRVNQDDYKVDLVLHMVNNAGPTLDNRTDLAFFPCMNKSIRPQIVSDKKVGCLPLEVNLTGISFSTPEPNFWEWTYDDGTSKDSTRNAKHTFFTAGKHKIRLKAGLVSSCGPSYYEQIEYTVEVLPNLSVYIKADKESICIGDTVTLQATGHGPYIWNTGETGNSIRVSPLATTFYTLTGHVDLNQCYKSDSIAIEVAQKPYVLLDPLDTICGGINYPTTLAAYGDAKRYVWNDGYKGPKRVVSPEATTRYAVTAYNATNCYDTASVVLNVHPNPAIKVEMNRKEYCEGDTVVLKLKSVLPNSWTTISGPDVYFMGDSLSFVPIPYGTSNLYQIQMTTNKGCMNQAYVSVNFRKKPVLDSLPDQITLCERSDLTIKDLPLSLTNVSWVGPEGYTSASRDAFVARITKSREGYYAISGKMEGCDVQDSVYVKVAGKPDSTIYGLSAFYCEGQRIQFGVVGDTVVWTGPHLFSSTKNELLFDPATSAQAGTYKASITNRYGCKSSNFAVLEIRPNPNAQVTSNPYLFLCEGGGFDLDAQVSPAGASYSWEGPDGFSSTFLHAHVAPATFAQGGYYKITATQNGCSDKDSVYVLIDTYPDSLIVAVDGRLAICEQGYSVIEMKSATSPSKQLLTWYKVGQSNPVATSESLKLSSPDQTGEYYAIVKSENGLCPSKKSNVLKAKIYQLPSAVLWPNPLIVDYQEGLTVPMPLKSVFAGVDSVRFVSWSPATWLRHPDSLRTVIVPEPIRRQFDYSLTLETGNDSVRCVRSFSFLFLNRYPIFIPNVFSPNGDGLNDEWVIKGLEGYPQTCVYVYNRWGNLVYENETGYRLFWDGKKDGEEMPVATYYYIVKLKGSIDNSDHDLPGSVTIIR